MHLGHWGSHELYMQQIFLMYNIKHCFFSTFIFLVSFKNLLSEIFCVRFNFYRPSSISITFAIHIFKLLHKVIKVQKCQVWPCSYSTGCCSKMLRQAVTYHHPLQWVQPPVITSLVPQWLFSSATSLIQNMLWNRWNPVSFLYCHCKHVTFTQVKAQIAVEMSHQCMEK